ncbi:hypothetical protein [Microbacterium sp.]|uniref:hypothetical protein n=1 Tax=Microbacterium sp. TaxID=51671 RepID=UPI002E34DB40|nr:hypothetical protein [Microbacterium sp.]HEX5728459.1 hypothetical protein [Microbacterium sp.]
MPTTTYEAIRDAQIVAIEAAIPSSHVAMRFKVHPLDQEFDAWTEEHPDACFRRFDIANNFDYQIEGTTDGATDRYNHTVTVSVAYPLELARYGVANHRSLDGVIDVDFSRIDGAIGRRAAVNYPAGMNLGLYLSMTPVRLPSAWIIRLIYQIEYDRSV